MNKQWQIVENWLEANFPLGLKNLGPPASSKEVEKLQSLVGPLPDELKELLEIHNGEQPEEIWLLGNWSLLPTEYIAKLWGDEIKMAERLDCDLEPDKYVKPGLWNPKWIPFAYDGSGGYLCVDMNPAQAGTIGQVIMTSSDGFSRRVSSSIKELLQNFANELINGNYEVVNDCLEYDYEWWS